jgi:hypothetical protein
MFTPLVLCGSSCRPAFLIAFAGQVRADAGAARGRGLHRAPSAKLGSALAHRGEAHARAAVFSDAPSVVGDLHAQRPGRLVERDADEASARRGVALRVVYGLEGDSVGGDLDRGRQRRQLLRCLDVHADADAVVIGVGSQRPEKPEGVERRRPERVDEAANVRDGGLGAIHDVGEQLPGAFGVGGDEVSRGFGHHRQAGELRPEAIVQVAPEAAALLLTGRHQPLARALEVGREPQGLVGEADGVGGHTDLVREVLEQPPVRGREALVAGARSEHQPTDRLTPVDERQVKRVSRGGPRDRSGFERALSLELDLGVRELQRLLHRSGDGGQDGVGG